jgi:hypothetical protein
MYTLFAQELLIYTNIFFKRLERRIVYVWVVSLSLRRFVGRGGSDFEEGDSVGVAIRALRGVGGREGTGE